MSKKVKVIFPGGRTTYMDRKTAETKTVVKMGGKIVEELLPEVPKVYAKPIVEVTETVERPTKVKDDTFSFNLKTSADDTVKETANQAGKTNPKKST